MSGAVLARAGGDRTETSTLHAALAEQKRATKKVSEQWFTPTGIGAAVPCLSCGDSFRFHKSTWRGTSAPQSGDGDAPTGCGDLERAGIHVVGYSDSPSATGHRAVVLHLVQRSHALHHPEWLPAALQRPTRVEPLRSDDGSRDVLTGRALRDGLGSLLQAGGIDVRINDGGFAESASTGKKIGDAVYTVSVAAPAGDLPAGASPKAAGLTDATWWAHELASGSVNTPTPELTDFSDSGITRASVSLGPVQGWCGERGTGLVAGPQPAGEAAAPWSAAVAHATMLAHSVFIDLAFLVADQHRFLRDRARILADNARLAHDGDLTGMAARYREAQWQLIDFLGNRWFEEVPQRESATRVLRSMQAARYLPDRLSHVEREHATFLRFLETREQEQQAARQREETQKREDEEDARARIGHVVQLIAALVIPVTLVFSVTGGTGLELSTTAIVVTSVIAVVLTVGACATAWWWSRRQQRLCHDRPAPQ